MERLPSPILGLSWVRRILGRPGCSPRPLGAAGTCPGEEGRLRLPRAGWGSPRSVQSPRAGVVCAPSTPELLSVADCACSSPDAPFPSPSYCCFWKRVHDWISSLRRVKVRRPGGPGGGLGARRTLRCLARMLQRGVLNFGLPAYREARNVAGSDWVPRGRGSSLVLHSGFSGEGSGEVCFPHSTPLLRLSLSPGW